MERALVARGANRPPFTVDGPEDAMLQGGTVPGRLATATYGARPAEHRPDLRCYQRTDPVAAVGP
ncbi:hypothetical protein [Streptomyces sp. NPDC085540]|uniref:hypothetical protein n=1 Tax=Streptomyces sp. NPDC085540 TaxID=3365730 RepID=UPI0037D2BEEE